MSATIRTAPDGRRHVTCDACRAAATTPFREVAFRWARDHRCPPRGTTHEPTGDAA